ncbi:hypothetical protein CDD80_768 [Ophiocordyceps camponoti-rufipedis]|uniref:Dolichol-phosphate mannosyltransferase subunit 3 n=1 Tax=Ophiocordyceps camponoti-rufipedis TaxID=2004952 RepID=A0A2C5YIJ1_9HYPO|nr:hypothetical protein CDD80_768 [Ophiocordyceps camponoti-rufipedis]
MYLILVTYPITHQPRTVGSHTEDPLHPSESRLYLALYLELIPLPPPIHEKIVPVVRNPPYSVTRYPAKPFYQLPFWALVSFGALLLFRLGLGLVTFNDVPDAHKELMLEIDLAKSDLKSLGVDLD